MKKSEAQAIATLAGILNVNNERIVFISAERPEADNAARTAELRKSLDILKACGRIQGYQQALGRYAGISEDSFMVSINEDAAIDSLLNQARYFDQESILVVSKHEWSGQKQGTLLFLDDTPSIEIGFAAFVPASLAATQYSDAHSLFASESDASLALVFTTDENAGIAA